MDEPGQTLLKIGVRVGRGRVADRCDTRCWLPIDIIPDANLNRRLETRMTNVKRNTRDEAEATAPTLMVIGGGARESANGTFIDVENPANHTVVGRVPRAADADVDAAVHAAAGAFDEWRTVAPRDRGRALVRIADAIDADLESVARMLALETATPSGRRRARKSGAPRTCSVTSAAWPASSRAKRFHWASTCSATHAASRSASSAP